MSFRSSDAAIVAPNLVDEGGGGGGDGETLVKYI